MIDYYEKNPLILLDVGIVVVKDVNHRFVACNKVFMDLAGCSLDNIIGSNDEDMPWANDSQIYVDHEIDIMNGINYSVMEPLNGTTCINIVTNKKIILNSSGVISGTIAQAVIAPKNIRLNGIRHSKHYPQLTGAENLVISHLIIGKNRTEVAKALDISVKTYDFHFKNIKKKLRVHSLSELLFSLNES